MGDKNYSQEIYERFSHGEALNADSIKLNKDLEFTTSNGRKVYGGGGIMPDIFVPNDTSGITKYYYAVANAGLLQKYAFDYCDKNRPLLKKCKTSKEVLKSLPDDDTLLEDFVNYCKKSKIAAQWYYINTSRELMLSIIKSLIARDALGSHAYYEVYNEYDNNIKEAIKQIIMGSTKPPIAISHK